MADSTLKRLIALLTNESPLGIRRAAVVIVGALKPAKERALNDALVGLLDHPDGELRRLAVEALGDIRAEEALPALVHLVENAGAEVEAAARAIGHMGARGTRALGQVMRQAHPPLRRRIAAALALAGTDSAVLATAQTLLDEDASVVTASARSLASEAPQLTAGQKRVLADHLLQWLQPAHGRSGHRPHGKATGNGRQKNQAHQATALSNVSEAAVVRVLAALHVPEAEEAFWPRLEMHRPAALRAVVLQALANLPLPTMEKKLHKLFACAADTEFQVVAPALMLLKKVPAAKKNVGHWLALFEAPDVAAHQLAVEKLREVDAPEVAKALIRQLQHPDQGLREAALGALIELKAGREALFDGLLAAANADEAWMLARAQVRAAAQWSSAQRAACFVAACKAHDADDRRADPHWFVLRETDTAWLRDQQIQKATALRKKKDFAGSLRYWRLVTRDPAVGPELRFELAATALKTSSHDTAAAAREADFALHQFSRMLLDSDFDVIGHIRKAKWLEESDLFYLGFHFAEQPRHAGDFGRQVLELVMQRWPKSQAAKSARHKLKSEGK
jgi:HEAT repeat protein